MKRLLLIIVFLNLLCSCQTSQIKTNYPHMPNNEYLDGGGSKIGIILCHGRNGSPKSKVVDPLRKCIHKELGYHTISLQMPIVGDNFYEFGSFFPDAYKKIDAAIQVLKREKEVKTIYLIGHSLGSRMATGYLSETPDSVVKGFIGVGVRNGGPAPLDSAYNLKTAMEKSINLKILDVYGDGWDKKDAKHALGRIYLVSDRYKQILIPGADHRFSSGENQMVAEVITWLKEQN